MNTAENTMSSFPSAKAAGLLEAEDKFHSYKVGVARECGGVDRLFLHPHANSPSSLLFFAVFTLNRVINMLCVCVLCVVWLCVCVLCVCVLCCCVLCVCVLCVVWLCVVLLCAVCCVWCGCVLCAVCLCAVCCVVVCCVVELWCFYDHVVLSFQTQATSLCF